VSNIESSQARLVRVFAHDFESVPSYVLDS
jgi:hypothetical protein